MILALVLAAALAPPSPQPSPLKEIVRVRSSSFCTAVRENLAVAVLALRNNDAIIARGGDTFAKMGHDSAVDARIAMSLDEVRLENVEDAIVHNLALMDRLIQDSGRFPASPKTADDALLKDLQRETNAVADRQRKSLNVISLTLDAQQRMELQDQDDSMGAGTLVTPSKSLPAFRRHQSRNERARGSPFPISDERGSRKTHYRGVGVRRRNTSDRDESSGHRQRRKSARRFDNGRRQRV